MTRILARPHRARRLRALAFGVPPPRRPTSRRWRTRSPRSSASRPSSSAPPSAALAARVDAALAAGKLTPEQAAKLKERIANAKGLGLGVKRGFAKKQQALVKRIGAQGEAPRRRAAYLGLTREQVRAELKAGKSLAQIAAAQGKTAAGLVAAMLAPVKERLAKAVAAKRLTQQRADEILERLTSGSSSA